MLPHPLTNFRIQKSYQNNPKFNGVLYFDFPQIKGGAYIMNLDEHKSLGTVLIALYVNDDNLIHALDLNKFQNKLKSSKATKISWICIEHKHTIQ